MTTVSISAQELNVSVQQMVSAMFVSTLQVSIAATSMGIGMAAVGASAYGQKPSEIPGSAAVIRDLRLAFGAPIVDQAVKNVGAENLLTLANEVERLVKEDMYTKYGALATDTALLSATPGDVQGARYLAQSLASKGYGKAADKASIPDQVVKQADAAVETNPKVTHDKKAVQDLQTGVIYSSLNKAGQAVARAEPELGFDPKDSHVWYTVHRYYPNRFRVMSDLLPVVVAQEAPTAAIPVAAPRPSFTSSQSIPLSQAFEGELIGSTFSPPTPQMLGNAVRSALPEWQKVLAAASGPGPVKNPRKFVERVTVIVTPSSFNPTNIADTEYTELYDWNGRSLIHGPSYSYDSLANMTSNFSAVSVDVLPGQRKWVCTYNGAGGGYWSTVDVYVNPEDVKKSAALRMLAGAY